MNRPDTVTVEFVAQPRLVWLLGAVDPGQFVHRLAGPADIREGCRNNHCHAHRVGVQAVVVFLPDTRLRTETEGQVGGGIRVAARLGPRLTFNSIVPSGVRRNRIAGPGSGITVQVRHRITAVDSRCGSQQVQTRAPSRVRVAEAAVSHDCRGDVFRKSRVRHVGVVGNRLVDEVGGQSRVAVDTDEGVRVGGVLLPGVLVAGEVTERVEKSARIHVTHGRDRATDTAAGRSPIDPLIVADGGGD